MYKNKENVFNGNFIKNYSKGPLSCLRLFLVTESALKFMKICYCFTSKAFFVIKMFNPKTAWGDAGGGI